MGASPRQASLRGITGGLPGAPIGRKAPQATLREEGQAPVGAATEAVGSAAAGAGGGASQPLPE
jgi:hypothetical protein